MTATFELKRLSFEGIGAALEKAERYRLLNEAHEAESICSDILVIDPGNRQAQVMLILALSDQLGQDMNRFEQAMQAVSRLTGYDRSYYEGILCERRAKAHHSAKGPIAGAVAYDWFRRAMVCYEAAERQRPAGNDDAILRWNTCARLIMRHADLAPAVEERVQEVFLE